MTWELWWKGNYKPYEAWLWREEGYLRHFREICPTTTFEHIGILTEERALELQSTETFRSVERGLRVSFTRDPYYFRRVREQQLAHEQKGRAFLDQLADDKVDKASNQQLASLLKVLWELAEPVAAHCNHAFYVGLLLEGDVREWLEGEMRIRRHSEPVGEWLEILTVPWEDTLTLREEQEFVTIAKFADELGLKEPTADTVLTHPLLSMKLKAHAHKFGWMADLWGTGNDEQVEDYAKTLAHWLRDGEVPERERRSGRQATLREKARTLLLELKPPAEIMTVMEGLRISAVIKAETELYFSLLAKRARPLFVESAARVGLTPGQARQLIPPELITLLREGKKADLALIHERHSHCVLWMKEDRLRVISGDEAHRTGQEVLRQFEKKPAEARVLKGVPASPGTTEGTARVLQTSAEIDCVGEGDILVAPCTSIDYVPAMKRAAAIVTELGGITSHAAIVSREFGIPCVVGIANATRTIKDGEKVRVKGSEGVVERL